MSAIRDNWTRDAEGNYVDWTKPPYRAPNSGILTLLMRGESRHDMTPALHSKRLTEYCTLVRRDFQKRREQNQKRLETR